MCLKNKIKLDSGRAGGVGGGGEGVWLFPGPYGQKDPAQVSSPIFDLISMTM
jgi:hypothetical protein